MVSDMTYEIVTTVLLVLSCLSLTGLSYLNKRQRYFIEELVKDLEQCKTELHTEKEASMVMALIINRQTVIDTLDRGLEEQFLSSNISAGRWGEIIECLDQDLPATKGE